MTSLSGTTALVTGAAKRIGRAIALALADQGINVIVHYHGSEDEARQTAADIEKRGAKAYLAQADLSVTDKAGELIERLVRQVGPIDFLINNASIFPAGTLTEFEPRALSDNITTNALAPCLLARAVAAQGRRGAIINLLDARIVDYDREHVPYHLSKRMLFSLTQMMALEFAPAIRVNAIAPGLILPPHGKDEAYLASLASTNPLNQYGNPDDIAQAAVFLLKSGFITGQVIFVDGGRHLRGSMYGC